jgi:hypothetical protein
MNNMKNKSLFRYFVTALILIIVAWIALTIYVERMGPSKHWKFESANAKKDALIVFDPDPFYNLDEQICIAFGNALAEEDVNALVVTVAAADQFNAKDFDVIVYCANTYNWRPDWAISNFIEDSGPLQSISSVGITLGSGSTEASQKHLDKIIINSGGKLIGSYSLWLWRPNDETKMKQPNVQVAVAMAHDWGKQIAVLIH